MTPVQAVRKAKEHILELFNDESIAQVGLEELAFKDVEDVWEVTIGFQRLWKPVSPPLLNIGSHSSRRTYKTVCMRNNGEVISVRHRAISVPA